METGREWVDVAGPPRVSIVTWRECVCVCVGVCVCVRARVHVCGQV